MQLQQVIDRLKTITALRSVQGAAELASAIKAPTVATPGAFVVPMKDQPGPDHGFTGSTVQQVLSTISVVLVVDNKRDATGAAAAVDLEPLRIAVRQKLLGWAPDGAEAPFTASDGALIDLDNGRVWWGDQYQTEQLWSSQ